MGRGPPGHSRRAGSAPGPGDGRLNLHDSRRLTGPNILSDLPGAIVDIALSPSRASGTESRADSGARSLAEAWTIQARRILEAVGWEDASLEHRVFPRGVSLFLSAPIDALYAATEVNEWAWEAARAVVEGGQEPDVSEAAEHLRAVIAEERNPRLLALREAAARHGVMCLSDDDHASVGTGKGSLSWNVRDLPDPSEVDWNAVHDIPAALITGTNGKTTTVRVMKAMVDAAGLTAGVSSTDWIQVGDTIVDRDDWSGPGGARRVLRDRSVDVALLETARGGMLRRGLAVERADAAVITNVGEDHLGEWGVDDISTLVRTKFVVARAARELILNADDPEIVKMAGALDPEEAGTLRSGKPEALRSGKPDIPRLTWFTLDAKPVAIGHRNRGGRVVALEGDHLVIWEGAKTTPIASVADVPMTLGGAARYNIANALAAIALADSIGLSHEAIASGLRDFACTPETNPGRLNVYELGGVRVLVDYAHNPQGVEAVMDMAAALGNERLLVLLGQAGDRTESSIRELARTVWGARPDRIVIKEMRQHLRGREVGEVPRIILDELRSLGASADDLDHADTELEGAHRALRWARPGDLLLLLCHAERDAVIELLDQLTRRNWRPGDAVPSL